MKEKLTSNAQAVLDIVRVVDNHPTALEIFETVKHVQPRIGLASVYRILHHLLFFSRQGVKYVPGTTTYIYQSTQ